MQESTPPKQNPGGQKSNETRSLVFALFICTLMSIMSYYYLLAVVDNTALYPKNLVATAGALLASIIFPLMLTGMALTTLERRTRIAIPGIAIAVIILVVSLVPLVLFAYFFWFRSP